MSPLPAVAVVVPVRNRLEKTKRCLALLATQTYVNLLVIVVDSNSTDGTDRFVAACGGNVILVEAGDDDYWTSATNRGVERALSEQAEIVCTLNDDAIVDENFVANAVDLMSEREVDVLAATIYEMDGVTIWSAGVCRQRWRRLLFSHIRDAPGELKQVDMVCGDGVFFRRAIFERHGLFDERRFPHYHGDTMYTEMLTRRGVRVAVSDRVRVINEPNQPPPAHLRIRGIAKLVPEIRKAAMSKRSQLYLPAVVYALAGRRDPFELAAQTVLYVCYLVVRSIRSAVSGIRP